MGLIKFIKSTFGFVEKYTNHPEAIVITCFFNPMNSPYRIKAFNQFYNSIKHLNHRVIECAIVNEDSQLNHFNNKNFSLVRSDSVLWHKESLLNKVIRDLPKKYKYVFWIDADVIFTNKNWLVDSVNKLKEGATIIQPFEYCIHLNQDEIKPSFDADEFRDTVSNPKYRHKQMWRSFSANYSDDTERLRKYRNFEIYKNKNVELNSSSTNYDQHGHVGFAWGARREVLDKVHLYDKALIGGADHIIAHAAVGQIPHSCITNAFRDDLDNVLNWSSNFYAVTKGKLSYAKGDLYHIWHGDIDKRQYLKRVKDFTVQTKHISEKDSNGLYVAKKGQDTYVKKYLQHREVSPTVAPYTHTTNVTHTSCNYSNHDDGFLQSMAMGYMTDSSLMGGLMGGNFLGGMIGAELRDSQNHTIDSAPAFENHHHHTLDVPQSIPTDGINAPQYVPDDNGTNSIHHTSNNNQDNGNFS